MNQVLTGRHPGSGVISLVPNLAEGEVLARTEGEKPERPEECLTSQPAPDGPAPKVGNPEIGGGGPSQELQSNRDSAGIRNREKKRHRLAGAGAGRCLQGQTELSGLRRRLSGWSEHQAPG